MEEKTPQTLSIAGERNKNAVTIPVTGAWGGPSPSNESIVAHFFIEYRTVPTIIEVDIDKEGTADPNKGRPISRGDYTREVQATLVMSPETAVNVGKWLQEKGAYLLAQRGSK